MSQMISNAAGSNSVITMPDRQSQQGGKDYIGTMFGGILPKPIREPVQNLVSPFTSPLSSVYSMIPGMTMVMEQIVSLQNQVNQMQDSLMGQIPGMSNLSGRR